MPRSLLRVLLPALLLLAALPATAADGPATAADSPVRLTKDDAAQTVAVTIDGQPFAVFRYAGFKKPFLDDLTAPGGIVVTRPLGDKTVTDHPHHKGLWVGLEKVNGHDHWAEHDTVVTRGVDLLPTPGTELLESLVDCRLVIRNEVAGETAAFKVLNDWLDHEGKPLLSETTTVRIHADRLVEYDITLTPAGGEAITFGDTKEGFFAVRMANGLREKGGTGTITSASGGTGEPQTWGQPAAWVDYSGTLDGSPVGIALFDHPGNFRPARYHVRAYGLFAASPFGESAYTNGKEEAKPVTLAPGESLRLRYAAFVHAGDAKTANVAQRYRDYTAE